MTVLTVGSIIVVAVVAASVVVLYRRGRSTGSAAPGGRSAAELDATARSASARMSDRQGTGPF
ncbi:MAG TPA: hypothetical protein VFZ64_10595 [Nocardioidaceae bacterium]